jgi:hypothetical protein
MKKVLLSFFLLSILIAKGQNTNEDVYDTAKRIDPYSTTPEYLHRGFYFNNKPDSTMLFLQQYDRIKRNSIGIQNLGDIGTPYINQQFIPTQNIGFKSGLNIFGDMYFTKDNVKHYNSKIPYSEFAYTQGNAGQRGMINFEALHTQNFGENINISIRYHSIAYDGFYTRQSLSNKHIQFSSYIRSKNKKYILSLYLNWNKNNQLENGGIEQSADNDTLFRRLRASTRLVPVLLNNAKNINRLREHSIKQTYWLKTVKDSSNNIGISHRFTAFRQSNYYTDKTTDYSFYNNTYYYNTYYSADSTGLNMYSNSIEIFNPLKSKGLSFKAGAQYDYIQYLEKANAGNYFTGIFHNVSLYARFDFNFLNSFQSNASGRFYLNGYNQGNYLLEWNNKKRISDKQKINFTANAKASSQQVNFRDIKRISNHYVWNNSFNSIDVKTLSLSIEKLRKSSSEYSGFTYTLPNKTFVWKLDYHLIDNWMYYDSMGMPQQGNKGQNCLQNTFYAHLNLRHFQLDQTLLVQSFSKHLKSITLLPELVSKSSLYYQGYAFKKATFVQIGVDAYMSNSYQARFYNPGNMQFQLSQYKVGAYPYLDFFINAEVKTARIFFKMEHVNMDVPSKYTYPNYFYNSPFQPSSPRRFRLGFIWKFYY